jgi:hypothetical protein
MKSPSDQELIPITRAELLGLTVGSVLGGGALSGVLAFGLERFGRLGAAVSYPAAFVVLGLCLFLPLKLKQRSIGTQLTFGRFLGACGAGAVVVGLLTHLLR